MLEIKCIAAAPGCLESEVVYKKYTVKDSNRAEHEMRHIHNESAQENNDFGMARPAHHFGRDSLGGDEDEDGKTDSLNLDNLDGFGTGPHHAGMLSANNTPGHLMREMSIGIGLTFSSRPGSQRRKHTDNYGGSNKGSELDEDDDNLL
jgi:hypothetical protein